jgi:nucleoid DNA-binding protein
MTKTELAAAIAAKTGLSKTVAYEALSAMEQQLNAESKARRAVELDDFGTFVPREIMGQRTGRILDGGLATYDNWKLVQDPKLVPQDKFIQRAAKRAGMELEDFEQFLASYKALVVRTLRRGGSVSSHSQGSFKVQSRKPRVFRNADGRITTKLPQRLAVVYKSCKTGQHQKFIAAPGLV